MVHHAIDNSGYENEAVKMTTTTTTMMMMMMITIIAHLNLVTT